MDEIEVPVPNGVRFRTNEKTWSDRDLLDPNDCQAVVAMAVSPANRGATRLSVISPLRTRLHSAYRPST